MIRQFRIHLDFLQNFCVHLQPLERSAAHPLRGLKLGRGEISLLPVTENKRLPYCNSIADFGSDLTTVIGMTFCTSLPNFA